MLYISERLEAFTTATYGVQWRILGKYGRILGLNGEYLSSQSYETLGALKYNLYLAND